MIFCAPSSSGNKCLKCLKTHGICPDKVNRAPPRIDPFLHGKDKFKKTEDVLRQISKVQAEGIERAKKSRIDAIGQNGNDGEHYTGSITYSPDFVAPLPLPLPGKFKISDGSTASYYELPKGAKELQDIISYKNMNSQIGEIFRSCMRYGEVEHSSQLRDIKKIIFYANEELVRLEKYGF